MSKGKFGSSCSQTLNSQETQRQRPVGGAYLGWSIVRILLLYLYFSTFWGTLIINVFKWYVKAQSLFFGRQKQIELLGVFNQIVWGCKWGEQKHNPCRNRRPSFWSGTGRNYNPRGNKIFSWFCEKARKGMGPFWLIQRLRAVEFASEMAGNQTIWYDFVRLCSFMRIAPIIQGTTTTANDHFVGISNLLRIPNLRYLPMKPQVDPDPTDCPNIWPCSVEKPIGLQTVLEVITTMRCQFFPVVGV